MFSEIIQAQVSTACSHSYAEAKKADFIEDRTMVTKRLGRAGEWRNKGEWITGTKIVTSEK